MNMETHIKADLSSRAMLVALNISQWSARARDNKVSQQIAEEHSARREAGNYNKALLSRDALAEINAIVSASRVQHLAMSLPWLQDGSRIIPVAQFDKYRATMAANREKFEAAVATFCENYGDYREQARAILGDLYNVEDYPTLADVRRRFAWNVAVLPVPSASDFRVDLDATTVARLQQEMAENLDKALADATRDVFERLHKVVVAMAEKLTAFDPTKGKQGGVFRDSLVENVREMVATLPALNIAGDARLADAIDLAEQCLTRHDADDLRKDTALREETAKAAQDIADAMAGWMA